MVDNASSQHKYKIIILSFFTTLVTTLCVYLVFRASTLLSPGYSLIERFFAILLLLTEGFFLFNVATYSLNLIGAIMKYEEVSRMVFVPALFHEPKVAIFITSFNEDESVLEKSLKAATSIDYRNKEIFLLDDSTEPKLMKAAERLAEKYQVRFVHRKERRGFKAGAINDALKLTDAEYIAIFDADQMPASNFLKEVIPFFIRDPKLAIIQTPQYYINQDASRVAKASAYQQAVFYEYIAEGKYVYDAMFYCGTNCVLRRKALESVGGIYEESVTEDFVTSIMLHSKGWNSKYLNKPYVEGDGPTTLGAYFIQQSRWALGTLQTFKMLLKKLITNPRLLKIGQWWQYIYSSTWYFVGWAIFILILTPIMFLLFDVRSMIGDFKAYIASFIPYFSLVHLMFYGSMWKRRYRIKDLFISYVLIFISFPVYMTAAVSALSGRKMSFKVTPKKTGSGTILPLRSLWPQILILVISLISITVGIFKFLVNHDVGVLVNMVWVFYHALLLCGIFYFNKPTREGYKDKRIFTEFDMKKIR